MYRFPKSIKRKEINENKIKSKSKKITEIMNEQLSSEKKSSFMQPAGMLNLYYGNNLISHLYVYCIVLYMYIVLYCICIHMYMYVIIMY